MADETRSFMPRKRRMVASAFDVSRGAQDLFDQSSASTIPSIRPESDVSRKLKNGSNTTPAARRQQPRACR